MKVDLLEQIEKQIIASKPSTERAQAFKLINELRILDCARFMTRDIPRGENPKPVESLRQLMQEIPLEVGSVRVRANKLWEALEVLFPSLEIYED